MQPSEGSFILTPIAYREEKKLAVFHAILLISIIHSISFNSIMTTKALDSRIQALLRNGVQEKKRSFVVVIGDNHAKDVIVHLHYIMSSMDIKSQNRSVLWAYKKDLLGFTRSEIKYHFMSKLQEQLVNVAHLVTARSAKTRSRKR